MNGPYHLYDAVTGVFVGQTFHCNVADPVVAAEFARSNTPEGHAVYEGAVADHASQRVDVETGGLVNHQPPSPGLDFVWCGDTRRWHLSPAAMLRIDSRAASAARIVFLENSAHRFVRQHALGDPDARRRLEEIQDEIEALEMHLEEK
jgi:hypothetical protein